MKIGIKNLKKFIAKHEKFIISTHESPDADGLGSEICLKMLLEKFGKKVVVYNCDPVPENLKFIDPENELSVLTKESKIPEDIGSYGQFVLDTNDYDNTGTTYYILKDKVKDVFIIDHHESKSDKSQSDFIKVDASSVCEIMYQILMHYNIEPDLKIATALYTGIIFDTGSLKYPKTTDETLKITAHCVKIGVQPYDIYQRLWEQNSLSSFKLRGKILSTMEIFHDGQLIAMQLTKKMLDETNALFEEGETSINLPLTIKGVRISLLVKETNEGQVKVSMRSKGDYNVAEIAIENGGGGHKNAAGFKSKLSFEETYNNAVKNLDFFFKK